MSTWSTTNKTLNGKIVIKRKQEAKCIKNHTSVSPRTKHSGGRVSLALHLQKRNEKKKKKKETKKTRKRIPATCSCDTKKFSTFLYKKNIYIYIQNIKEN